MLDERAALVDRLMGIAGVAESFHSPIANNYVHLLIPRDRDPEAVVRGIAEATAPLNHADNALLEACAAIVAEHPDAAAERALTQWRECGRRRVNLQGIRWAQEVAARIDACLAQGAYARRGGDPAAIVDPAPRGPNAPIDPPAPAPTIARIDLRPNASTDPNASIDPNPRGANARAAPTPRGPDAPINPPALAPPNARIDLRRPDAPIDPPAAAPPNARIDRLSRDHPAVLDAFRAVPRPMLELVRINGYLRPEQIAAVLPRIADDLRTSTLGAAVDRVEVARLAPSVDVRAIDHPTLIVYLRGPELDDDALASAIDRIARRFDAAGPGVPLRLRYALPLTDNATLTQGYFLFKRYLALVGLLGELYDREAGYALTCPTRRGLERALRGRTADSLVSP